MVEEESWDERVAKEVRFDWVKEVHSHSPASFAGAKESLNTSKSCFVASMTVCL
jgi:hypothetical protein